jgi:hypothetical protein
VEGCYLVVGGELAAGDLAAENQGDDATGMFLQTPHMVTRKSQRRGQMPLLARCRADPFSMIGKPLSTSFAAGNDITVIALWVGHEQVTTTQLYPHADLTYKSAPSSALDLSESSQVVSNPAMPCLPSWKSSDYAENFRAFSV